MIYRVKCLSCGDKNIRDIIHLGSHPFADTFTKKIIKLKKYPLIVQLCKKCFFIQNKYITNDNSRYNEFDYSYISSNSKSAKIHWKNYISNLEKNNIKIKNSRILEVGSNDGFFLKELIKKKCREAIGVEASKFMFKYSKARGLNVINEIFGKIPHKKISKFLNKFDLIIANNVFNHSNCPNKFLSQIKKILNDDGKFVFEQPYWLNTIKDYKFDLIYHEHVSHSTIGSLINLLNKNNLNFYDCELVDYHGTSIRVYCSKNKNIKTSVRMIRLLKKENLYKLNQISTYIKYMKKIKNKKNVFLKKLNKYINLGFTPVCIGAAAKGNTFLNYHDLSSKQIKYVTDASKDKIGKYTPSTCIPIVKDSILTKIQKPLCIILSWNIAKVLKSKMIKLNKNIVFLSS